MNEKHQDSLKMYVNDVIALEHDVLHAVEGQLSDERVTSHTQLAAVLSEIVGGAKARMESLKSLSEAEGGSFGAAIKGAVTEVTGTLAGIYGKLREHPLSRMVRDDTIAMNLTETSYSMLYTLALGIGHSRCADIALQGINAAPPLVLRLTDLMPGIILEELAKDAPLTNPSAEQVVVAAIHDAWK